MRYALQVWHWRGMGDSPYRNDKCAICSRIKTIEHCFLECPRVVKLWEHFSPLLSILLDSPFSIFPRSVFYPFSSTQSSTGTSLSNYLIVKIIYWCWFARNRATFRNSLLSSEKVIDLIK